MCYKKIKFILILSLLYQSPLLSKSNTFEDLDSKNVSKYFSGIVAYENRNNSLALSYFNSSKILINQHDPYLERFILSLVLEDKVKQAINYLKISSNKTNSNFFEAHILLILDNIKKNNLDKALKLISEVPEYLQKDKVNFIILDSLRNYVFVFKEKKLQKNKQSFGNLSLINETFQI